MRNKITHIPNTEKFMDNVMLKYPDIAENILKKLDDKTLKNCIKVSKMWGTFFATQRFAWIRRIKNHALLHWQEKILDW